MHFWLAIAIFILAYIFIISDKIHRTITAMLGGTIIIALGW